MIALPLKATAPATAMVSPIQRGFDAVASRIGDYYKNHS
jgi:hypothetical protein